MVRRLAAAASIAWAVAGCYDVPQPPCGFACGPSFACPEDYVCITGRCILESAVSTASCLHPDGGIPIDGSDALPPDLNMSPAVTARMPLEFADPVSVDTTVSVTFSEPVIGVDSFSFRLEEIFGTTLNANLSSTDSTTFVLTPTQPLRKGVTHVVTLTSQIMDAEGAVLPFTQWNFRTEPDLDPPTIAAQVPAPSATAVPIDNQLSVRFNEDVIGVDQTTFTVRDGGGIQVPGFATYDPASFIATFQNTDVLLPNTTYTMRLSGAITDAGGNPLTGAPVMWSFTTGADTIPPQVTSQSPSPGAININIGSNFGAWFSEDVVNVTNATFVLRQGTTVIPATVTYFAGSRQAILDPNPFLTPGATHTLTLEPAITDAAGNSLVGAPITWSFTTQPDTSPPFVSLHTPSFGATNVPLGSVVTASFSEDVQNVNSTTFTITPGGGVVSYNSTNRVATLVPAPALTPATVYTVNLTTGITDLSGNPLTPRTFTFGTTADGTAPTVSMTTPATGATSVPRTSPIVVQFDEPVINVTGQTFRVDAGGGIGGTISSALSGSQWTFTPSAQLPANTLVTVTLTSGITDATGNPLAGPVTFTFTTEP